MKRPISFEQAKNMYVHRFTIEHVPEWAKNTNENGLFCQPQYKTDLEWYENTDFPGEGFVGKRKQNCYAKNQSWPLGKEMTKTFFKPSLLLN